MLVEVVEDEVQMTIVALSTADFVAQIVICSDHVSFLTLFSLCAVVLDVFILFFLFSIHVDRCDTCVAFG